MIIIIWAIAVSVISILIPYGMLFGYSVFRIASFESFWE